MAYSRPEYPARHEGPALVVGTGPPVAGDLRNAEGLRPGAARIGINEAGAITGLSHLVTMHPERMGEFVARHKETWGWTPIAHAPLSLGPKEHLSDYPAVDYWWNGVLSSATSAWTAIWVAQAMGFDEVILVGCPMNGGDGYAVATRDGTPADPRFGYKEPDRGIVASYKETFAIHAANLGEGVYSMSGFSRECLGAPE